MHRSFFKLSKLWKRAEKAQRNDRRNRRSSVSPHRLYYKMCELFLAEHKNIARSLVLLPVRRVRLLRELAVRKARSFSSWNHRSRHRADTTDYFPESSSGGIHACKLRGITSFSNIGYLGLIEQIRRLLVNG